MIIAMTSAHIVAIYVVNIVSHLVSLACRRSIILTHSPLSFSLESMTDALRDKSTMDAETAALKSIEGANLLRCCLLPPPCMTPRQHAQSIHSSALTTQARRSLRISALHSPTIASLLWRCCRRLFIWRQLSSGQQPQKHASGSWCETRAQWRQLQ